jgi:hypothetical protein
MARILGTSKLAAVMCGLVFAPVLGGASLAAQGTPDTYSREVRKQAPKRDTKPKPAVDRPAGTVAGGKKGAVATGTGATVRKHHKTKKARKATGGH